jgi:hypothetical protein
MKRTHSLFTIHYSPFISSNFMTKLSRLLSLCIFLSSSLSAQSPDNVKYEPVYKAVNGSIVGHNTGRYNNRPLYINNTNAFILTGDQPIARLVQGEFIYGTFMLAVLHNGKIKWLQQCEQITSFYRAGTMSWEITDPLLKDLKVSLEVLPMALTTGMAVRAVAEGVKQGDSLIWAFGAANWRKDQNLSWKLDVMGQPELLTWGFDPEECLYNKVIVKSQKCYVALSEQTAERNNLFTVAGHCSELSEYATGDALLWSNTGTFKKSQSEKHPLLYGSVAIEQGKSIYWAFEAFKIHDVPEISQIDDPEKAFAEGRKRTDSFLHRLRISTPDPYLDAMAESSVAAVDGTWYPPVFVHGGLQWNIRFPGWRTIFGGTMYGWHDRVMDEARFYTGFQVISSDKKEAKADTATLLTEQHPDSRFYGVGYINKDQGFYNMQSEFFDQIVEEYRWTGDPSLVKFFRKALELHLQWVRDCFDPDGDGVYESYINLWGSDSQWYNGGGTAEETSYAYRGHLAARDMARSEGDQEAVKYHTMMLEKIKKGFFSKLWITQKGYPGSYREQGGHERLHENPWLYSIFLPVDAGLTTRQQSIESVYYTESALQNDRMPAGGRKVWTSNWVPSIWSVRELWPGDNYHLALSYFQAGLPDDGYDIMRGTYMYSGFDHLSPGNLGGMQGGIDFGDCVHTFTRALVSGLFGYRPDYPNEKVVIAPQFPTTWDHASIELPDVKIAFRARDNKSSYSIELNRIADLEILLPVQCEEIKNVSVNGMKVKWTLIPDAGRSLLKIQLAGTAKAEISVETINPLPYYGPAYFEGNSGETLKIATENARIISVEDPQGVFREQKTENGEVTGIIKASKGYHTLILQTVSGKTPQMRIIRIKVNDPSGDAHNEARTEEKVPAGATWDPVDIHSSFNADVTTIYKQKYLSPRPNTVSLRLGSDGYSPWTFTHWKSVPPVIKTDYVTRMLDQREQLVTPQGVPFFWAMGDRNVSFTSMWDNYPAKMDFPVNKTGNAIYFLVCGSTNVMQCQIANAVIRLNYADGQTDSLELVPPVNYWNLSTIEAHAGGPGQASASDYNSKANSFCMPARLPETVNLGENCRAMLLNLKMRNGVELKSITLETLSQEVVVGIMGISIRK